MTMIVTMTTTTSTMTMEHHCQELRSSGFGGSCTVPFKFDTPPSDDKVRTSQSGTRTSSGNMPPASTASKSVLKPVSSIPVDSKKAKEVVGHAGSQQGKSKDSVQASESNNSMHKNRDSVESKSKLNQQGQKSSNLAADSGTPLCKGLMHMTMVGDHKEPREGTAQNQPNSVKQLSLDTYMPDSWILEEIKTERKPIHLIVDSPRRRIATIRLTARHPDVYEPCEDSFALVDALLADKVNLVERQPTLCLEVGCGSGYVITSLALLMGQGSNAQYMATDINHVAAQVTCNTLAAHGVEADVIVTNLVTGLEKRLAGAVDVLVFNPPYVPTSEDEVGMAGITSSWAGGERGRTVIDRMLAIVDMLVSSKGLFYLLTLTANNPGEICQIMNKKGFASRIIIQRTTEEESLHVLKFWRENADDTTEKGIQPTLQTSLSAKIARLAFWR